MRSVSGDLIPTSFVLPLIAGVTIAAIALTLYCFSHGISTVFMHLYYLPIILIAYFYRRRGIPVLTGLSLFYLALAAFFLYPSIIESGAAVLRTGTFILIGVVVAELSERLEKKKEDCRIAQEYQKSIIDNANVWLTILDAKGKILIWNCAAETMSGYHADEVLGQTGIWKALYPDKDYRRKITGTITRIITEKNYLENFESEVRTKNGSTRTISWNTRGMMNDEGAVEWYVAIGLDTTEHKRAEEALRQAYKQLNLLSSITRHDILNQLMALKGYLYLSHEVIDNPTILSGYLQKEEQAANAIEAQITFTRDYQNLGVAAPEWQSVNASIDKALSGLPMRDIRVEVDPKNPAIFADRLFEKVFYNLIDNASVTGVRR
ncbi:MAG: PAS domain S-box protein [Methanoregula sp.]|nr:PAS domain S-box protein [Methanoregula sp.]